MCTSVTYACRMYVYVCVCCMYVDDTLCGVYVDDTNYRAHTGICEICSHSTWVILHSDYCISLFSLLAYESKL